MKDAFSESKKELLAASRLCIRTALALHDGFTGLLRAASQRPDGWIPLLATYVPAHGTLAFMRLDSMASMQLAIEGAEFARALSLIRDLGETMRRELRPDGSLGPAGARARMLWSLIVDEVHFMADDLQDDPLSAVLKNAVRVHSLVQVGGTRSGDKIEVQQVILKVQERFGSGELCSAPGVKLGRACALTPSAM